MWNKISSSRVFITKYFRNNRQGGLGVLQLISCRCYLMVTLGENSGGISILHPFVSTVGYSLWFLSLKCSLGFGFSEKKHVLFIVICFLFLWSAHLPLGVLCVALGCCKELRPKQPLLIDLVYTVTLSPWSTGMGHGRLECNRLCDVTGTRCVYTRPTHLCSGFHTLVPNLEAFPGYIAISVRTVHRRVWEHNILLYRHCV